MKIYTLERELWVPATLDRAFQFFSDPHNLAEITPPSLGFRITTPEPIQMRAGTQLGYRIGWAGLSLSWTTVIERYEPPVQFVDVQVQGPYRLWRHHHTFRSCEGGTLVGDRVDYALPFGPLGRLTHALAVRGQLNAIFDYRAARLRAILRAPATAR